MADRERKPGHSIVEPEQAALETESGMHEPSGQSMVHHGTIPPVMTGFQTPAPTASERAFGPNTRDSQAIGATSTQGAPTATSVGDMDTRWHNEGTKCERKQPAGICILSDTQRSRYITDFKDLVTRALGHYQDALTWAKVEQLIQKDDEVSIIGTMLVSLAGGWVLGHLVGALAAARNGALSHVVSNLSEQAVPGASSTERIFSSVTDQRLQSWTSAAFEPVKGAISKPQAQSTSADSATEKQQTMSYIDYLKDSADTAYRGFELATLGDSDDAALLVAWLAMQPKDHTETKYRQLVKEKVDGFKKSGVMDIGHKNVVDRRHDGTLHVDTRVVWVKGPGATRLHYEKQKSIDSGWSPAPTSFDGGFARHLGARVPEEFVDIALARSEARWGPTQTIADQFLDKKGPVETTMDAFHRSSAPRQPSALPPSSVFSSQEAGHELAPFNELPAGSVFDPRQATSSPASSTAEATSTEDPLAPFRNVKI